MHWFCSKKRHRSLRGKNFLYSVFFFYFLFLFCLSFLLLFCFICYVFSSYLFNREQLHLAEDLMARVQDSLRRQQKEQVDTKDIAKVERELERIFEELDQLNMKQVSERVEKRKKEGELTKICRKYSIKH